MRARTELPELLTADEVAAWLKTTRKAIYAKAERGSLPGVTYIGRRLYFVQAELLS
jgi:predicted DNA-binding transcriptional regulator AlpA